MKLSVIAAVAHGGVIGRANALPWNLPADLERFKKLTMGHHLLMGRRTWESIGRLLPGRTTVVVSRGGVEVPAGVLTAASLEEAVKLAAGRGDDEAFVAGGAELYRRALPRADRLYLTRVLAPVQGDVLFPAWNPAEWRLIERRDLAAGADTGTPLPLRFEVYERAVEA